MYIDTGAGRLSGQTPPDKGTLDKSPKDKYPRLRRYINNDLGVIMIPEIHPPKLIMQWNKMPNARQKQK